MFLPSGRQNAIGQSFRPIMKRLARSMFVDKRIDPSPLAAKQVAALVQFDDDSLKWNDSREIEFLLRLVAPGRSEGCLAEPR